MKSITFEKRLRSYKEQKYKLLLTKQELTDSKLTGIQKQKLEKAINETLALVDIAINSCTRIVEYTQGIESELKTYQIIEQKLGEIMLKNDFAEASTQMTVNKLDQVGEHVHHLEQLLKYKK